MNLKTYNIQTEHVESKTRGITTINKVVAAPSFAHAVKMANRHNLGIDDEIIAIWKRDNIVEMVQQQTSAEEKPNENII